jgi:hypothetical protein
MERRSGRRWGRWFGVAGAVVVTCAVAGQAVGAESPTVPGAPVITSVTAGDHSVRVAFTRPSSGGSPIFSYKATCISSDGGATRSESNSSLNVVVDNLTATKTYTCTVTARNHVGTGPASAPSGSVVVLPLLPGAVTITTVVAGDHNVRVVFTKPTTSGGSPIFSYKATCVSSNGGVTRSQSQFSRSFLVNNLTPGKSYTCTVMARNSVGFGPPSAPSVSFVALPLLAGAPTIVSATPGVQTITLVFSPPAAATDIFDYRASCSSSDGGVTRTKDQGGSPIVVSSLTTDKTYACTVMAENSIGFGPLSTASTPVMTLGPPGAPTITSVAPGSRSVTVSFSPPATDGGSTILGYEAMCASSDGGVTRWVDATTSPIGVSSLSPGNTYTCTVAAKNSVGFGPSTSPASAVVTLP